MNPQTEEAEIVLSRKNKIWTHGSTPLKSFKKQRQKENLESNESGKTNDLARQWPSDRWQVSKEQRRSQKTREGHLQYIENTYPVTEHSIPCRRLIPEVKQSNFHSSRVCHWRSLTHSLRGLFRNVLRSKETGPKNKERGVPSNNGHRNEGTLGPSQGA